MMVRDSSKRVTPISFDLDRATPIPLHYQIQQQLRGAIDEGRLQVGDALPPEPDLAVDAGVSRSTIRQAIDQLVRDGLVRRQRGRGTFVSEAPVPYAVDRSYSTADSWQAQGLAQAGPVLRAGRGQPSPFVRDVLQLPSGQSVMEVVRMRMAGDEPLAVETVYLATGRAPANLQDVVEDGTLYQALERATGLELTHAEVTVQAVILQGETARLLKVASGSPGLHLERRTYASTGEIVELAFTYVAGERQRLQLTVARAALMGV